MPSKTPFLVLVAGLLVAPGAARAQSAQADSALVYHREIFEYAPAGRPDPFRSLLNAADLGVRVEDLSLRGVVFRAASPRESVAVLEQAGVERRFRVRVGDRLGQVRVVAIGRRTVDLVVEELGVARRETLELKKSAPANRSGA